MPESMEMLRPLTAKLKAQDMPTEDLRLIAEMCGVEAAITLILTYSGMSIYVPKRAARALKIVYLRKAYTGANLRPLCRELDISQSTAFRWLGLSTEDAPNVEQTSLDLQW